MPMVATHSSALMNPRCGDHVRLEIRCVENVILEIGFAAKGCAICAASASLLCELVKGCQCLQSLDFADRFEKSVVASVEERWPDSILRLQSFAHLRVNPARRACAFLPWMALRMALNRHANA